MLTGKNLINGEWKASQQCSHSSELDMDFFFASSEQVDEACQAARGVFLDYGWKQPEERADFLRAIAAEILELKSFIVETARQETGLPQARLEGETMRTTGQLEMFADLIEQDEYPDIRRAAALPNREPLPRPDLRLTRRPIGPVVVFGASNFPLAFSAAGGDTASALAAGCPVIVKAHGAHPGTTELVAMATQKAALKTHMPNAVYQVLQGAGAEVGSALVEHPTIRGVGFTGSLRAGRILYNKCHSRPLPIPFYGELGSVNPVFMLSGAMHSRAEQLGNAWAGSLTMGAGQFCTNPGVVVALKNESLNTFLEAAIAELKNVAEQKMLTDGIHQAYTAGVAKWEQAMHERADCGTSNNPRHALPALFTVDAKAWMAQHQLQEEVFGPTGIVVECDTEDQMLVVAEQLQGQLTATMHLDDSDLDFAAKLSVILEEKAGRILCNGFPTGVEVCSAMMHGGPYPSSTDARSSSVGTIAIERWLRPVCYQNFPPSLLHAELQD